MDKGLFGILTKTMIMNDNDKADMLDEIEAYAYRTEKYRLMWRKNYPELSFTGFIHYKFSVLIDLLQPTILDIKFKTDMGVNYGAN